MFNSRKLLTFRLSGSNVASAPDIGSHSRTPDSYTGNSTFDANVAMILAVLLCALICALGLNSIIRCALRCSSRIGSDPARRIEASRLVTKGVKRKTLRRFPTVVFGDDSKPNGFGSDCAICLAEFQAGDKLRILPFCRHGFHIRCIDTWLAFHSSCPTCRCLMNDTCLKKVDPMPLQPLDHEAVANYRGFC
ncbi:hypothetical protein AMTRI_Chr11g94610 [Amborella trichopoda]|uniref:RING-type domain-containing protein n=1 Tax=Amborella trichopoda TaxID=13333 RepID=U5CRZ3_AMBTC|nr:hypothetical protein AMTR_s00030p00032810 [Amborella trichopoda]